MSKPQRLDNDEERQLDVSNLSMTVLGDRILRKVAGQLGPDWEKLASFLGFTVSEISNFKTDSPGQTENQIFHMLVKWRQRQPSSVDLIGILVKELKEIGRNDIADKLLSPEDLEPRVKDADQTVGDGDEACAFHGDSDYGEVDGIDGITQEFTVKSENPEYNEIRSEEIQMKEEISATESQSKVYKAVWKTPTGPKTVASKYCLHFKEDELLILSRLNHRNIIKLLGVVKLQLPPDGCVLVTEYAEKGSLYDLMDQHRDDWSVFKRPHWLEWALDGAKALQFIHQNKYQHGDVKSPNFVISGDDTLKICDFGTARNCVTTVSTVGIRGSWPWMAPEVMGKTRNDQPKVTTKSDVFSYAVVIWELLTGKVPFLGSEQFEIYKAVCKKGSRLQIPTDCTTDLRNLLTKCWKQDHQKRPDMDEVLTTLTKSMVIGIGSQPTVEPAPSPSTRTIVRLGLASGGLPPVEPTTRRISRPVKWFRGIAVSAYGEIARTDMADNKVVICTSEGIEKSVIQIQANDVAATPDYWVVVNPFVVKVYSMEDCKKVCQFEPRSSEGGKIKLVLHSAAVKKDGNVVVGDTRNFRLTEHSLTNGSLIRTTSVDTPPHFLAVDVRDRMVVSGEATVVVHDNVSKLFAIRPTISKKRVERCTGVSCHTSGIYVAVWDSSDSGHVHHYDHDGRFVRCVVQDLTQPQGMHSRQKSSWLWQT